MKKTFKVNDLKDKINSMLLHLPDSENNGREHLQVILERVLMESGNYKGYRYLDSDDMIGSDNGLSVGIKGVKGHNMQHSERFEGTDHTRVEYF